MKSSSLLAIFALVIPFAARAQNPDLRKVIAIQQARIEQLEKKLAAVSESCPKGMTHIGAWCMEDVVRPEATHREATESCRKAGLEICSFDATIMCDYANLAICSWSDTGTRQWVGGSCGMGATWPNERGANGTVCILGSNVLKAPEASELSLPYQCCRAAR